MDEVIRDSGFRKQPEPNTTANIGTVKGEGYDLSNELIQFAVNRSFSVDKLVLLHKDDHFILISEDEGQLQMLQSNFY